jgi:dipeptidyl aminopeptidase/acylaminoacyl peptidase
MIACSLRCFWALLLASVAGAQTKPALSLDDLFSLVEIRSARLSPDGSAAVFVTARPDWKHDRFREDIWLWRNGQDTLLPLAQSGHDSDPRWSPDGKRIAFISGRTLEAPGTSDDNKEDASKEVGRVWIIDLAGGEAYPLYREPLKVHSFAWTRDGSGIFFSVEEPLSKSAQEAKRREWKDVERWRADERGDVLLELRVDEAAPSTKPLPVETEEPPANEPASKSDKQQSATEIPKLARIVTRIRFAINEIAPATVGNQLAFLTNSISGRLEHPEAYEIYLIDASSTGETTGRQITHNQALERQLHWSTDGTRLYFGVFAASGNLESKYQDVQGRLYALEVSTGEIERQGKAFAGSWTDYALTPSGKLFGLGQLGTEVQVYSLEGTPAKVSSQSGTYEGIAACDHAAPILFEHSTADEAPELFLANDPAHLSSARQITHLNTLFASRNLPGIKTYRWKADDGQSIEGVLLYPPGQFEQKHLRMLTLIHGGPADAAGNKFGADWYSWALLAASNGWLVFQPNYRGSTGYGDAFMTAISPHIVSTPGRDILAGVDSLVKDGFADSEHLAIGGYSYGGYLTNWLITQTTRFRSAVTGAGAVEHASNWGNDDLTFDDAWYLGGMPWQNPSAYQSEAALFQFDKVRTPVHEVMGADDVRVSASQGYLLERALDAVDIPHEFLIFPGEGHGLGKNPWHGYIKVREELAWLEKYDRLRSSLRPPERRQRDALANNRPVRTQISRNAP